VAGPEYARLNTGGSITRGNSGNGALLTREIRAGREHKHEPNEALTVAAMGVNRVKLRHAVFRKKRYGPRAPKAFGVYVAASLGFEA
jgi:hypothetical protein